jgi:hypothetical protein
MRHSATVLNGGVGKEWIIGIIEGLSLVTEKNNINIDQVVHSLSVEIETMS